MALKINEIDDIKFLQEVNNPLTKQQISQVSSTAPETPQEIVQEQTLVQTAIPQSTQEDSQEVTQNLIQQDQSQQFDLDKLAKMSLQDLINEQKLPLIVTSSFRPGSKTKSGRASRHSQKDEHGNSMAYDIQPIFNGKIDKSDQGFIKAQEIIINNPTFRKWMEIHKFGILDETSPEVMRKTGATGKHYHIGADSTIQANYQNLLRKYNLV